MSLPSLLPWAVAAWLLGVGLYGIATSRNFVHLIGTALPPVPVAGPLLVAALLLVFGKALPQGAGHRWRGRRRTR